MGVDDERDVALHIDHRHAVEMVSPIGQEADVGEVEPIDLDDDGGRWEGFAEPTADFSPCRGRRGVARRTYIDPEPPGHLLVERPPVGTEGVDGPPRLVNGAGVVAIPPRGSEGEWVEPHPLEGDPV